MTSLDLFRRLDPPFAIGTNQILSEHDGSHLSVVLSVIELKNRFDVPAAERLVALQDCWQRTGIILPQEPSRLEHALENRLAHCFENSSF